MSSIPAVQWFARADRTLGSEPQALEVSVEVSGAHAAGGTGARELFTEATKTTLVFDDGAVVRLCAAVVVGQLLFLRHADSQKEIVTRVLRQRSFGTAIAYVELEFTEVVPGFWGAAVSRSESDATGSALRSADNTGISLERTSEASYQSSVDCDHSAIAGQDNDTHHQAHETRPAHPAPVAADAEEVARLREELAGLRSQMSSMLQPSASAAANGPVASGDRSASVASKMLACKLEPAADFAEADLPTASRESVAQFPPSAARGGVRVSIGLIAALLILGLVAASAYFNGFLKDWYAQRNVSAGGVNVPGSGHAQPMTSTHFAPSANPAGVSAGNQIENAASIVSTSSTAERGGAATFLATADRNNATQAVTRDAPYANRARLQEAAEKALQGAENQGSPLAAVLRNSNNSPVTPAPLKESVEESYEPPSLIKAVNAVPPADATRGFVTGDVKFEAVIDASGKVESAKVLSGPEPLREAALEALKHYQYKPAAKNGQSVSARLPVTVKFWYEP
jgi:TonB family protein